VLDNLVKLHIECECWVSERDGGSYDRLKPKKLKNVIQPQAIPSVLMISHLTLGYNFNQPVNNLPPTLTHLTIKNKFNKPVDKLTYTHSTHTRK
jgi:hypothetical protein